jgi:hypothetical protein
MQLLTVLTNPTFADTFDVPQFFTGDSFGTVLFVFQVMEYENSGATDVLSKYLTASRLL